MCEQNENNYLDGDVVWVKLGSCWWPGEIVGPEKLPPDVLPSFKKPPIAVVKFYQEDTYEYVKNLNSIFKYNCSRKNEFINKGLYMYRTKHGHMDKFPEDVIRAEIAVGGDKEILTRDEFQEVKKESYAGLFGDPRRTPASIKKGKNNKGRLSNDSTPVSRLREKTNYKVHILVQGTKSPRQSTESAPSPSTSRAGSEPLEATPQKEEKPQPEDQHAINTPNMSTPGIYACHACNFNTTRLNVLIMHNKTHSATFTPYTPTLTHLPIKKKLVAKTAKASPDTTSAPKIRKTKQEKDEKPVKKQAKKRIADESSDLEVKKSKTDAEIKSSLLADWDDGDEESNDESSIAVGGSPEIPIASESPAVPTSAELPSAQVPDEVVNKPDKNEEPVTIIEKPETSNDAKYEFCEDEDWPVETDIGRKIPRVKNPSKRKEETKSLSIDEDEMAREVAELLSKTTLPELPSAPETFKEEENFPDPSVVKSPDKQLEKVQTVVPEKTSSNDTQPAKKIFKTKTFFRSRHSRSQDAIGKYVAEQLNAAERLDMSENEINGAESVSSIEPRISPPVEHVKVARLAPKIQLKKMKAEAAQLLEREKHNTLKNMEQTNLDIPNIIEGAEKAAEVKIVHNEDNTSHQNYVNKDNQNIDLSMKETKKVYENEHETVTDKIKNINKEDVVVAQDKTISETTILGSNYPTKMTESNEPLMNESTASAVDALLSVSRETDRVTKIISDDPPEDLFEDDNKDNRMLSIANGINVEEHKRNGISEIVECSVSEDAENATHDHLNDSIDQGKIHNISPVLEEVDLKKDSSIVSQPSVDTVSNNTISEENHNQNTNNVITENIPSESDLQVAEALINLPSTNSIHIKVPIEPIVTMKTKTPEKKITLLNSSLDDGYKIIEEDEKNIISEIGPSVLPESIIANNESLASRFETEQEKCENLFAAQSLVQMSESIDHNINITEVNILKEKEIIKPILSSIIEKEQVSSSSTSEATEQNVILSSSDIISGQAAQTKSLLSESNSPKLLKILEEPTVPKIAPAKKTVGKQLIVPGNEKILNFDIGKASLKSKSPKQKIIIRRAPPTKTIINNIAEKPTSHKIILSPSTKSIQEGSSIKTYAIKSAPDVSSESNTIIYQPKLRKISKPVTKFQKIKPQTSQIAMKETKSDKDKPAAEAMFDINSMPVVLSDDILTPENIEKMPIVMSDGNILTTSSNPPKLLRKQTSNVNDNLPIAATSNKTEIKTLLMNPIGETKATTTPNILSKSSKIRGAKPMLVIDKTTGKQKIIMTKSDTAVKEIKTTTLLQPPPQPATKTEKFIILPTTSTQRPVRTQKIVIDPQTRKAHVLVGKGPEVAPSVIDNKPVSAKLISSSSDTSATGNTVMIITNAQGAQSRIVLTSEHEKILFPNKQQPQLKQIVHRITPSNGAAPKPTATAVTPMKTTPSRIVQKQKSTIITSKGQLIVGGRVATTAQSIAPLPEIRPAPKRIIATEPKKLVQAIQKNATEPWIFLQQKNGTVMQLTVSQFEHLQRTGQIVQKALPQDKIVIQKATTISPGETSTPPAQKQRVRKHVTETITSAKKVKHELAIAPARPITQMPTLAPLTNTISTPAVPPISSTSTVIPGSNYSELENFEELLPSTAIARQPEPIMGHSELVTPVQPQPAAVSDGQLLAIPGENFGGPPGSFYLCVEDNGTLTPIDNRPLVLENNQLVPMADPIPMLAPQPERRDILEAALANSDVFHAEPTRDDAPDFRDLNANVSVHCRVSETSTTLNQPIMTPVEVPSKVDCEPRVPSNLEDRLAVIGVTPHTVPTSLELPITVTDPRIAPKTTDPLSNNNYGTLMPSPNTEMTFVTTDETQVSVVGPISMPILTDEDSVGKSMPILTDEVADRTVSSVESALGSPSSIEVRESETEDGQQWPRRLLTPCSDTSEASTEIPLQPVIQLSVSDPHNS